MSRKQHNKLPFKHLKLVEDFSPKNKRQEEFIRLIEDYDITVAKGTPGSGKTFVALATALNLLGDIYKKVILIKSVNTLPGEEIGFLKGGMEEKMEPFVMSYSWNIDKLCGQGAAKDLLDKKLIEILPLAYIRGLSIDNSIVIIDECQNIDTHIFKSIITRIGENSKYIFLGDVEQIDLKAKKNSSLGIIFELFKDTELMGLVEFLDEDCVRNPIIPKILNVLRENNI